MSYLVPILMFLVATFLIVLVLVQRGKGGGLAGALGGMGGQSAFGTKAGDTFTRITVGVATFWILLCVVANVTLRDSDTGPDPTFGAGAQEAPLDGISSPAGSKEGANEEGPAAPADSGGATKE